MWVFGGMQVHGICGRRVVNKEVVKALSNYEKSYLWGFGIPLVMILLGVTRLKRNRFVYLLNLLKARG